MNRTSDRHLLCVRGKCFASLPPPCLIPQRHHHHTSPRLTHQQHNHIRRYTNSDSITDSFIGSFKTLFPLLPTGNTRPIAHSRVPSSSHFPTHSPIFLLTSPRFYPGQQPTRHLPVKPPPPPSAPFPGSVSHILPRAMLRRSTHEPRGFGSCIPEDEEAFSSGRMEDLSTLGLPLGRCCQGSC
jgi:hypothetical protein